MEIIFVFFLKKKRICVFHFVTLQVKINKMSKNIELMLNALPSKTFENNDRNSTTKLTSKENNPIISILKFSTANNEIEGKGKILRKRRSNGKHQMAACCSCKKKRKKCDGKYPTCSNCEKHRIPCTMIYCPTGREIRRDYLEELETYVKDLEDKLHNLKSEKNSPDIYLSSSSDSIYDDSNLQQKYPPIANKNKDLAQEVGFISLGAGGEPCYIGETSAYSIAKAISTSINCFPLNSNSEPDKLNSNFIFELPFRFPNLETSNQLLLCYKKSVQCQYPFLDWPFIEKCFNLVVKENNSDSIPNFFIFMIFAISSQIQDVSNNKISSSYTKSYYLKAFESVERVIESVNIYTVQAFLLMSVFSQKMPDGVPGWQAVGLAIRTAVVLGLHRKPYHRKNETITNEQRALEDLKSRIFWSAYGIERINGLVLGRPFSISDVEIDAPFPLETEDTKVGCHVVKLRRIQSSISTFIYKPVQLIDKSEDFDTTRVSILLELNEWMSTFPYKDDACSTFETDNWSLISYHNSILLLLRPVVLEIAKSKTKPAKRDLEWFKVFTESASSVCINYKNMHLKRKLSYTWSAMHCCFVSGISFLYCIWLDRTLKVLKWKRKSLVYETISACQTILYVLAERWSSASRFRDSFERLSTIVNSYIDSGDVDEEVSGVKHDNISNGVFVDGSIEIDSYLNGKQFVDKISHVNLFGNEKENLSNRCTFSSINTPDTSATERGLDSLWEFLDTTGDKYLRGIFNEMEDSLNFPI